MAAKVKDLFFDANGTYQATDADGRGIAGESLDIPVWVVEVIREKFGRGAVDAETAVYGPGGQKTTVGEILRRCP